jgi:hypothetical protein
MKYLSKRFFVFRRLNILFITTIFLFSFSLVVLAQEPPPRPVDVTVTQNLGFGAFAQGAAGGSITINTAGGRSSSGDIIPLNLGYSFNAAIYKLIANAGTVISIVNGPDVTLTGSGGGSMTLHIGASNPASPFVITAGPPASTLMNVGGTLTVGSPASNPPGSYSGNFDVTFMQE